MSDPDVTTERMRITYAFWLAVVGLSLAVGLTVFLVLEGGFKAGASADIVSIVGLFTSVLGTLVGAFFGVQIGSAGKERAEQNSKQARDEAQKANERAMKAVGLLSPDDANKVLGV